MKTALHLTLLNSFFLLCPANAVPAGEIIAGSFQQLDFDGGGWLTGFAAHPEGRLYARTDVGGAYRSDDRGATWRFISGDLPTRATHFVQGIAVSESSPDFVFQAVGDAKFAKGCRARSVEIRRRRDDVDASAGRRQFLRQRQVSLRRGVSRPPARRAGG